MKLYAAIDLHATNNVVVVIDEHDQMRLAPDRLKNDAAAVLGALAPFKDEITAVAVESTFNWYWLVDALQAAGYKVMLVHAAAVPQYAGLKHGNDDSDAFHLAHLMRLGILPTGTICPQPVRALRDLMRRRESLVQQQTRDLLILQSMFRRVLGQSVKISALDRPAIQKAFAQPADRCAALAVWKTWQGVQRQVEALERWINTRLRREPQLETLLTIPGVGPILGPMILLETGDIARFASVSKYASYCRMVDSKRLSNGKVKGHGNRKSGNGHLSWAWIEAANIAIRCDDSIERWYQRKLSQVKKLRVVAIKAVAHKLARAAYFMLRDGTSFESHRAFN
jgi:transposase